MTAGGVPKTKKKGSADVIGHPRVKTMVCRKRCYWTSSSLTMTPAMCRGCVKFVELFFRVPLVLSDRELVNLVV